MNVIEFIHDNEIDSVALFMQLYDGASFEEVQFAKAYIESVWKVADRKDIPFKAAIKVIDCQQKVIEEGDCVKEIM